MKHNSYTFDDVITLCRSVVSVDEFLQEKITYEKTDVLACIRNVSRSEFYLGKKLGLDIVLNFVINAFEYNGEKEVIFDGKKYSVVKTYALSGDLLELTCQLMVNGKV